MKDGLIFDIKRFAIYDGPGIRTTIFFKGCPLRCLWCQNPEGQRVEPEIMIWEYRCITCCACVKACPSDAISLSEIQSSNCKGKCTLCGTCIEACPSGARELVGRRVTAEELMREIEKDIPFYDESGGGVTFSGGEPLMQPDLLSNLLLCCQEEKIHTAVDTSGYSDKVTLLSISKNVDLFLYDLKIWDDQKHRKFTGVSNKLILKNLRELSFNHNQIVVRIPIIPGINDDDENINKLGEFASSLEGIRLIELLPFNRLSIDKHKRLKKSCGPFEAQPLSNKRISEIKRKLTQFNLKIQIRR